LPCREDGEFSKEFPKHILENTQPNVGGYPLDRRIKCPLTWALIKYPKKGNRHRLPPRERETQGVLVSDYVDNKLFHKIHTCSCVMNPTSMSRYVPPSLWSNTFLKTSTKDTIVRFLKLTAQREVPEKSHKITRMKFLLT
jgi:hypothetical protein